MSHTSCFMEQVGRKAKKVSWASTSLPGTEGEDKNHHHTRERRSRVSPKRRPTRRRNIMQRNETEQAEYDEMQRRWCFRILKYQPVAKFIVHACVKSRTISIRLQAIFAAVDELEGKQPGRQPEPKLMDQEIPQALKNVRENERMTYEYISKDPDCRDALFFFYRCSTIRKEFRQPGQALSSTDTDESANAKKVARQLQIPEVVESFEGLSETLQDMVAEMEQAEYDMQRRWCFRILKYQPVAKYIIHACANSRVASYQLQGFFAVVDELEGKQPGRQPEPKLMDQEIPQALKNFRENERMTYEYISKDPDCRDALLFFYCCSTIQKEFRQPGQSLSSTDTDESGNAKKVARQLQIPEVVESFEGLSETLQDMVADFTPLRNTGNPRQELKGHLGLSSSADHDDSSTTNPPADTPSEQSHAEESPPRTTKKRSSTSNPEGVAKKQARENEE